MYVRQLYGSSETGTISVNMNADIGDSLESVGSRPIAGVEVEIWSDEGEVVRSDAIGEMAVKSGAAIQSYGCEELDSGTFRNGYFLTGDLGRKDQYGLFS
jgi:long-chain acyl-CoA synthetase